jgi:GDPmannose 4,6-dehydratase
MHKMLQAPIAKDYLIATGITSSLNDFVRLAFASGNLNPEKYLISDDTLLRPSDLHYSAMNPGLISSELDWKAQLGLPEIVQYMLEDRIL